MCTCRWHPGNCPKAGLWLDAQYVRVWVTGHDYTARPCHFQPAAVTGQLPSRHANSPSLVHIPKQVRTGPSRKPNALDDHVNQQWPFACTRNLFTVFVSRSKPPASGPRKLLLHNVTLVVPEAELGLWKAMLLAPLSANAWVITPPLGPLKLFSVGLVGPASLGGLLLNWGLYARPIHACPFYASVVGREHQHCLVMFNESCLFSCRGPLFLPMGPF